MFQLKDAASITASQINWMKSVQKKVTDFNVGSIVRSMLEASAIEIDELYKQIFIGLKEAIPVAIYTSFNFPALSAAPASGVIQLTITAQPAIVNIAAGTVWVPNNGSINYTQTANVAIPIGITVVNIPVAAQVAGSVSNLPLGASFVPSPVPAGFVSATNLNSFINGFDDETAEDHKARFNSYISTLPRGTLAAIKYGLSLANIVDSSGNIIERVASSNVFEPWKTDVTQPVSLIRCYIHNGTGGTSGALVAQAQLVVDGYYDASGNPVPGWKAAGTQAIVAAATEVAINVTGVLTALPGFDKPTLIASAVPLISAYQQSLPIGSPMIFSKMTELVMDIAGVYDIVFSTPTADVIPTVSQKIMPGVITLT